MKSNAQTLQVEITIGPAKSRKGGRRGNSAETTVPDPPHLPRLARLMALAVKFQEMVDHGEVRDYADLARLGWWNAYDYFNHLRLKHLPKTDLSGLKLEFDIEYDPTLDGAMRPITQNERQRR